MIRQGIHIGDGEGICEGYGGEGDSQAVVTVGNGVNRDYGGVPRRYEPATRIIGGEKAKPLRLEGRKDLHMARSIERSLDS
jgi:hypothetical protein